MKLKFLFIILLLVSGVSYSQTIECVTDSLVDKRFPCSDCTEEDELFTGLLIRQNGLTRKIYDPFKVKIYDDRFFQLLDPYGNAKTLDINVLPMYGTKDSLLTFLEGCNSYGGGADTSYTETDPTFDPPTNTSQYYRGDRSLGTLNKNAVGLGNVDNTTDLGKPISTATQTALNNKLNVGVDTITGTHTHIDVSSIYKATSGQQNDIDGNGSVMTYGDRRTNIEAYGITIIDTLTDNQITLDADSSFIVRSVTPDNPNAILNKQELQALQWDANKIKGIALENGSPISGEYIKYDGTNFVYDTPSGGGGEKFGVEDTTASENRHFQIGGEQFEWSAYDGGDSSIYIQDNAGFYFAAINSSEANSLSIDAEKTTITNLVYTKEGGDGLFLSSSSDGTIGADSVDYDIIAETATGKKFTNTLKTKLDGISGTNTGDQTSIVGISGTKSEYNTSCSDGNFMFVGDPITGLPTYVTLTSNTTNNSMTASDVNTFDINIDSGYTYLIKLDAWYSSTSTTLGGGVSFTSNGAGGTFGAMVLAQINTTGSTSASTFAIGSYAGGSASFSPGDEVIGYVTPSVGVIDVPHHYNLTLVIKCNNSGSLDCKLKIENTPATITLYNYSVLSYVRF